MLCSPTRSSKHCLKYSKKRAATQIAEMTIARNEIDEIQVTRVPMIGYSDPRPRGTQQLPHTTSLSPPTTMSLSLADLGSELDSIRRRRAGDNEGRVDAETSSPLSAPLAIPHSPQSTTSSLPSCSPSASTSSSRSTGPSCLLCFERAPSAVLLPCGSYVC